MFEDSEVLSSMTLQHSKARKVIIELFDLNENDPTLEGVINLYTKRLLKIVEEGKVILQ